MYAALVKRLWVVALLSLVAACEDGDPMDAGAHDAGSTLDDGGGLDSGAGDGGGSDAGAPDAGLEAIGFATIQADLEAEGCTGTGGACHESAARNVLIVLDPDPTELRANWDRIVNVGPGVTPWVTPRDDSAQMLNEVAIPADVRARWLEWIVLGAPFDGR